MKEYETLTREKVDVVPFGCGMPETHLMQDWSDRTLDLILNGPTINGIKKDEVRAMLRETYTALKQYEKIGPMASPLERDDAGGHATPKPIALCERAILSSSRPGDLVVDFFGGSGSTLIACENTGRTCAMIELEPKWCDVIVRRYIKTTGDNNVRCVRQGQELPREEIAAIFEPDEEGGEQE